VNKPPMPDQPRTKPEMPAVVPQVPATLESVLREVRGIAGKVDRVQTAVGDVSDQVLEINERVRQLEGRTEKHSSAVRDTSKNDMRQDAAISAVLVEQAEAKKRDEALALALTKNTVVTEDVKKAVGGVLKHPAVIALGLALVYFLTNWLEKHTP